MTYGLPKSVEIDEAEYEVHYDFRVILDVFEALNDPELSDGEKVYVALRLFYVDVPADDEKAFRAMVRFINGGEDEIEKKSPKLIDWKQDFSRIVAPINRIAGKEVRDIPYSYEENTGGWHWWSFLACFMEIGDCLFAQIINIRNKKAKGKKLDKQEQEFYKANRDIIDIKTSYTEAETNLLNEWL